MNSRKNESYGKIGMKQTNKNWKMHNQPKKLTTIIVWKKFEKKEPDQNITISTSTKRRTINWVKNIQQKQPKEKKILSAMENMGYREGSSKLSKHRRMSRAASLAVEAGEGIPLSRYINFK